MLKKVGHYISVFMLIGFAWAYPQAAPVQAEKPKLTVVFILDQFAYHYIPKLRPYFRHGLKELLDNGIFYTNAFHAHGVPETTPGHHAISTGTLPKDHGGLFNQWLDKEGKKIPYDQDLSPEAALLSDSVNNNNTNNISGNQTRKGEHSKCEHYGKSCHNTMVDGLSDQFILSAQPGETHKAISVSLKSYPAIITATRLGKPIWFEEGNFTSSKYYFQELPTWLIALNQEQQISQLKSFTWKTMYPVTAPEYNFPNATNYDYAGFDFSLVSRQIIPIDRTQHCPYELFLKTPFAGEQLIHLAKACVTNNLTEPSDHMILWVCLSNLDLVGHYYGPESIEVIDTIYHLDRQLKDFMDFARQKVGEDKCLFVMTADHGIIPIPELKQKAGFSLARRIMGPALMDQMNQLIKKNFNVSNVVQGFIPTSFQLNHAVLDKLHPDKTNAIIQDLKKFLQKQEGIKKVWTRKELRNTTFKYDQLENFYKTQLYPGRDNDIICMPQPYCLLTEYPKGVSHSTPYDYDTHVPLVLYQKGRFENKVIAQKVWVPQLPVTLGYILKVTRPSASTYPLLPGIAN